MRKNVMQVFHSVRTWRVFCRHWQAFIVFIWKIKWKFNHNQTVLQQKPEQSIYFWIFY